MNNMLRFFQVVSFLFVGLSISAQYATRKTSEKQRAYTDSLKQVEYNYLFPILGQKTYRAGFDIPYPIGIMGNYLWMDQSLVFDNMQLGLLTDNVDIPLTDVDEFINFGENTNTSYSVNVRPDVWVFPFLNVYGIFGYGQSETNVQLVEPVPLNTTVKQNLRTAGVGVMGAFGIGSAWVSLDGNWTWSKPELLDKPVRVSVFGIRVGKTFKFEHRPERNIAFWMGAMRIRMSSTTEGQIALGDALPPDVWDRRDEIVAEYWGWYDGLLPPIQEKVDNTPLPDIIERLEQADGSVIIRYGMDKQVKEEWNGVIGIQYQMNKRWMLRSEGGIIGDRKSFLFSLNYRFLL
jgi:hypothetical protein